MHYFMRQFFISEAKLWSELNLAFKEVKVSAQKFVRLCSGYYYSLKFFDRNFYYVYSYFTPDLFISADVRNGVHVLQKPAHVKEVENNNDDDTEQEGELQDKAKIIPDIKKKNDQDEAKF